MNQEETLETKEIEKPKKIGFFRALYNKINEPNSLFSYAMTVFVLAAFWMAFALIANKFAFMFGWDHVSQYLTFYYDYWDIWRDFYATGEFTLVDFTTYLGVDNIGSNSYYGLFDPFVIILSFFPRSWIPQTFTISTMLKITVSALIMRCYLKNMEIKEGTARFGSIAYAFSGYMTFMCGFSSFVSVVTYVPMLMLGIEKVIKEFKPSVLIWSLFLIGITSFFFLVVLCIWGVMYAIWRFFQTVSTRYLKENIKVMIMGVASFAVGLMLCAFTLIPSLRQSTLSGRTESIGSNYLSALLNSFSDGTFFSLIFEQVGGSVGREIMPLVSFFFPTGGYLYLPMMVPDASYKYDAWVASIFCYAPFVILFFLALINSGRRKKWSHFVAVAICLYLLFTDFAYFFFFAFTGAGYGRWFLILVPCIIYYGCWAYDDTRDAHVALPIIAGILAIAGTGLTYLLTVLLLKGQTFENTGGYTYFVSSYLTAGEYESTYNGYTYNTIFTLIYELVFVVAEAVGLGFFSKKKWFPKVATWFLFAEVIIMGNMSFVFCGYWNLEKSYNGGTDNFSDSIVLADMISAQDDLVYRTFMSTSGSEKNFQNSAGYNGSSTFHSLLNFETYQYAIISHMANAGSSGKAYGKSYYNPSWSGYYVNKRLMTDIKQGYKYYVVTDGGYPGFESENVPFNSEKIGSYYNTSTYKNYRIYRNNDAISLGYAVDSNSLYKMNMADNVTYGKCAFYSYGDSDKLEMAEEVMVKGGIFDDDFSLEGFDIKNPDGLSSTAKKLTMATSNSETSDKKYKVKLYTTSLNDLYLASSDSGYRDEGPGYYLNHYVNAVDKYNTFYYTKDIDKVALFPNKGTYFNEDPRGCYFDISLARPYDSDQGKSTSQKPRIYMIGDLFDDDGNITQSNVLLNHEFESFDNNCWEHGTEVFGMWAKGRVKVITFCYPSGGPTPIFSSANTLYMREYSEVINLTEALHNNELKDVKRLSKNSLGCTSNYSEKKIVSTHLAYDASWKITANGNSVQTFKIDGGFLGFLAPSGETEYVLDYQTEGLSIGIVLFVAGTSIYFTYVGIDFLQTAKKKREGSLLENV